jgi:hypothetical protein
MITRIYRNGNNPIVLSSNGQGYLAESPNDAFCPFVLRFIPTKMGFFNGIWYAIKERIMIIHNGNNPGNTDDGSVLVILPPLFDCQVFSTDEEPFLVCVLTTDEHLEIFGICAKGLEKRLTIPNICSHIAICGSLLVVSTNARKEDMDPFLQKIVYVLPLNTIPPINIYQRHDDEMHYIKLLYSAQQLSVNPGLGAWNAAHHGCSDVWINGRTIIFTCMESKKHLMEDSIRQLFRKDAKSYFTKEFFEIQCLHRWILYDSQEERYYYQIELPSNIQYYDGYYWEKGSEMIFFDSHHEMVCWIY